MAVQVGFTRDQADFMLEYLSQPGHSHTADQIEDLDKAVEEILIEDLDKAVEEILDERSE